MKCTRVRLGAICQEIYRYPTYYDIEYIDEGVPEIRGELITSDGSINLNREKWRFISEKTSSKFSRTVLLEDDLVMSVRGTIGKIGLIPKELVGANITANLIRISPNRLKVNERYLWIYMRSPEFINSLNSASSSTTIKTIKAPDFKDILIPLPPIAEQKRIAEILDRTQSLISKRKEAIAKLDTLTQSIFIEMFGDPESILNLWTTQKLGSLLEFLTSGSRGWASYYAESGDLFLRIQNVRWDELLLDDIAFVKAPISAEATRTKVKAGDVLLSITADLGRTAVVPEGISTAYINQHLAILRPKSIQSRFLSAYFASPSGRRQVQGRNQQGVKAGLNFDAIRSFLIPCPPLPLQKEFAQRVEAVEKLKATHHASLSELQALFASLQHRAFRGEL